MIKNELVLNLPTFIFFSNYSMYMTQRETDLSIFLKWIFIYSIYFDFAFIMVICLLKLKMTKNKNILEHAWCEIYTSILKRTSQKHFFRTYPKKNLNQKNNWGTKPSPTFNDIDVFHFCLEISQLPRRIGNISDNDWSFNATWEHRVCTLSMLYRYSLHVRDVE